MKTITSRLAPSVGILLLTLSAFCQAPPPLPPPDPFLDGYGFQATNALSFFGDPPLAATNLVIVPEWDGNAVLFDSTNTTPVYLKYCVTTNDRTNICFSTGALELIFICCYASADTNQNGSGPGTEADLLAAGDTASGLWRVFVGPSGTNIVFGGVSNSASTVFVSAPISWPSNSIHLVGISYTTTNSSIYLDGELAGTGNPVSIVPATNTWTNGFATGSDLDGYAQCQGILCRLALYDSNFSSEFDGGFFTNRWPYYSNLYGSWLGGGSGPDVSSPRVFNPVGAGGCSTNAAVFITNFVAGLDASTNMAVSMDIQGGPDGVFYDLYTTTNLAGNETWLAQVLTCTTYSFSNQPPNAAFYILRPPTVTMAVAWGDNTYGECNVPAGLSNAVAVAAGVDFSLALLNNGTVIGWGEGANGQTNIPSGLTNVLSIAAGYSQGVALLASGAVTNWGSYDDDGSFYAVGGYAAPPSSNVVAISAGFAYDLALRSDGSVTNWGVPGATGNSVPAGLSGVAAIASGYEFNAALLSNGTVVAWGDNSFGETNVPGGLTNVVALAANGINGMALRSDGTVEAWGYSGFGLTSVPEGLSNVVAISEGFYFSLALQANGTVVVWGNTNAPYNYNDPPYLMPAGVVGVKAISAGYLHNLIIKSPPSPVILEEPTNQYALVGGSVTFSAEGQALAGFQYQWQFNGVNLAGQTNATLTLTGVGASNNGTYQIVAFNASGSVASAAVFTLVVPPEIDYTIPATSGVYWFQPAYDYLYADVANVYPPPYSPVYQWQLDGTNIAGSTSSNYSASADGAYTVVITNGAGSTNATWDVLLAAPGMVEAWGSDTNGECDRPATLTNAMAIAAGDYHSVAVTDGGTVVQWGNYSDGTSFYAVGSPPSLTNAVAVAASRGHDLALLANGLVTNWGLTNDVANFVPTNLPPVKAIAAGWYHNIALLTNGSVTGWGSNSNGQTTIPDDLTNANGATAIAAGQLFSLALRSNGTVEAWGDNTYGQTNVPSGLTGVVAIAAGGQHCLALNSNGFVIAWGNNDFGQTNVPSGMSNVMAIAAGSAHSLALINDGTIVSWGDNSGGQTNTPSESPQVTVKLIAAGGDHSMAAIYSPLVQYPVDVSKDLLLIYNTNSPGNGSSNVCAYYLANRPMVANANVLAIGCTTNEIIEPGDYATNLAGPVQSWLATNPTKRPAYVILFQDIPSRVDIASPTPSVQYELSTACATNWHPFVTSINMNGIGGTNDCVAYVDKLATMASNNPPGTLFISATAAHYGNTNWYFNDTPNEPLYLVGYSADLGVFAEDPTATIVYTNGNPPNYISRGTNVAGYLSWGYNGDLPGTYAVDGSVVFTGNSGWYLIATAESFNGQRVTYQGNFLDWFSSNAFGGVNYTNTPVGAITHVDEPLVYADDTYDYFGNWTSKKCFAICAWAGQKGTYPSPGETDAWFQAVGDPFLTK